MNGSEGRGVANIAPMLTITRLHNSVSAVGAMRRYPQQSFHEHSEDNNIFVFHVVSSILLLSRDYSTKRVAFRKYIADHPLHTQTLARMEVSEYLIQIPLPPNNFVYSVFPTSLIFSGVVLLIKYTRIYFEFFRRGGKNSYLGGGGGTL